MHVSCMLLLSCFFTPLSSKAHNRNWRKILIGIGISFYLFKCKRYGDLSQVTVTAHGILVYCILQIVVFNSVSWCKMNRVSLRSWVRLRSIWQGVVHMGKWGRNQPASTWVMDIVGRWFSVGLCFSLFYGWRHWTFFFLCFHWSLCRRTLCNILIVCCPWIEHRLFYRIGK